MVKEGQQVMITQFGKPVGEPVTSAGLKVKVPFIQKAHFLDKRFLEWDGDPNEVPTKDKRFIYVDSYARWRISDPLLFFQRLRNEASAQSRLDDILDGETRNAIAKYDLVEVVRLTNRKPEHRRGKVQLIDATQWFRPLRKNMGMKNCELSDDDIRRICDIFLASEESSGVNGEAITVALGGLG